MSVWSFTRIGKRFRLGKALGFALVQDQTGNPHGSALQKKTCDIVFETVMQKGICTSGRQTRKMPVIYFRIKDSYSPALWHWQPKNISMTFSSSQTLQNRSYSIDSTKSNSSNSRPSSSESSKQPVKDNTDSPMEDVSQKDEAQLEAKTESVGIFKRFKQTFKMYGKLAICVHCVTSCVWYGSFYYAVTTGLDVIAILQYLGAGESIIKPFQSTGLGNFAAAYLLYKIATPARYTVTMVGTPLTARKLRDWGYMEPVPEGAKIRDLMSEGKEKMKDKYGNIKDEVKELKVDMKDKVGDIKSDLKDKAGEFREDFKDKLQDLKKKKSKR